MGARVAHEIEASSWPIDYVGRVSPVPLLIVHNGLDTLISRSESESLFSVAKSPKDYLHVAGAFHDSPMASATEVIDWLDQRLSRSAS